MNRFPSHLLVTLLLAAVGASSASAQMSYTRATFTDTYTPISVGGGATPITFATTDDATASIPLPFDFTYAGTAFTTSNFLAVCTNGWAFFSLSSVTTPAFATNINLYTTSTPNNTLAPYWDDLNVGAVGTNPAGSVLHQTQGAPGSRTLTVQWTNVSSFFSTTSGQPRQINFQLVLHETSNVIEFRYGSIAGASYNTAESASIGIEDGVGGPNRYLDATTGSGLTNNGMITTNKWPTRFFRFTPGAPAPLAGGTYGAGSGGAYPSLGEAVADVNHRGISGPVTLSVTDAVVDSTTNPFPILVGPIAGSSAVNTLTIMPSGGTSTLSYRGTESGNCGNAASTSAIGSSSEPILGLVGADFVTVRNLTLSTLGNGLVDRGISVINSSATDGAKNNTFRELSITLNRANTSSVAIHQNVVTTPTAASGQNDANRYYNSNVANAFAGIQLTGNSSFPDLGCEVGGTTVGGAGANDIGNGTGQTWGIRATSQSGVKIFNCEVRNVTGTGTSTVDGIFLENAGGTTTSVGTCEVSENVVHDLSGTSASAGVVAGLRVNLTGNASSVSRVFNNFVYGLTSASTVTTSRRVIGLRIQDAGSGSGATHNVDFNSVRMAPAGIACSNSALEIGTTSGPVMNVRNNVLANFTAAQSGSAKHYAWVSTATATIGPAGSVSDRNVLYVSNPGNGFIGLTNVTDRTNLSDWQAAVSQDANSHSADPQFQTPTNLHISPVNPTPVESNGSYFGGAITWVPADIDADVRDGGSPDIGADEGLFVKLLTNDIAATALVDPAPGSTKQGGVAFSPQASFTNGGTVNQTNVPVRYRIVGPSPSTAEVYNQTATIATLNSGAGATTVTFPGTSIATEGVYTMFAKAENPGDQNAANDEITGTFDVLAPLCGTYLVGSAQGFPFNSLTNAVARLNLVGVSCAVVFELTDPSYSASETFPITIAPFPGASASNTVTIRPSATLGAAATPTISGASSTSIIRLNGADHVIIDGSSTGGTSRDLTISNTSSAGATAAVWLSSLGAGAGATNNVIRNCILACGVDQSSSSSETFGILTSGAAISATSDGADNDDNAFINNAIARARWGIYLRGAAGNPNDNCVVRGNLIGPEAFGGEQIGKGGIALEHQNLATVHRNEVRFVGVLFSQTASGSDRIGIGLGGVGWTTTGTPVTNSAVTRNRIHDIVDEKTFSAVGIVVAGTGTPSSNTVANNFIYDIRANGTVSDQALGIGIATGSGDVVAFNSISMTGDMDPGTTATATQSAAGIRVSSTSVANLTLKNNITSVDVSSNTATLRHFSVVAPSTAFSWGTGGSNHNDYWVNPASPQMVLGGIGTTVPYTNVATLAAWRTQFTPNQDGASVSANPPFLSGTDLHINPAVPTPLESGGTPIAGIVDDFDGDARHVSTPDIGADEGAFTPLPNNDVAPTAFVDPLDAGSKVAGTPFSPKALFSNVGALDQTDVPVRYRIVGPAPSLAEVYNETATIATLAAGGGPTTVTFGPVTLAAGTYTMEASTELVGDENTANDEITGSFEAAAPLCGTYPVGSAQAFPFNTLSNAIARLNTVGVSCAVVFELTDAAYGAGETFPITIHAVAGGSATNTVTIRPSAAPGIASTPTISGSSAGGLIVLNGADHVTIDGSNNASTSRDLTIANTGAGTSSAVVWGQTTSGGDPATNNVIKNCNISGSGSTQTLFGIGFGGTTISTTSAGTSNNGNRVENCNLSRSQYGIYSSGASAAVKNTGTVIRRNLINTGPGNNVQIGGILVRFEDGVRIEGNEISEINRLTTAFGISLGYPAAANLLTATAAEVVNAAVIGNAIGVISSTDPIGYTAVGIAVSPATSGVTTIANNMISGVISPATPADATMGIFLGGGAGSTTRVYFNSVSMVGSRGAATNPSFGLAITGANPVVDVKNNIFSNSQTSTGAGKSYAIGLNYGAPYTNLASDYNDLVTSGTSAAFSKIGGLAQTAGSDRTSLAAWQGETGQDANSISANPLFVSASNLHIDNTGPTASPVANRGVPVGGIADDIDGEPGNRLSRPDIGADEFTTYDLTLATVGNGSVSASPADPTYNPGASVQVTATPAAKHHFTGWSGDASGTDNPLKVVMNADKSITANFALNAYTITASAGAGGSITPSGAVGVAHGADQKFDVAPDPCYRIADVLVDGVSVGAVASYTFTNVEADHTIEASFALVTYTITASAGANGSITPSGAVSVGCGADQKFDVAADAGFEIADVLVDGVSVGAVASYTFTDVQADHTIEASFRDAAAPSVRLLSPNGGEILIVGTPTKIAWEASDNVGVTAIDLHVSRDGVGGPYEVIALGEENDGTFDWVVTPPGTNTGPAPVHSAFFRVVARDGAGNSASDESDAAVALYDLATETLVSRFEAAATGDGVELRWELRGAAVFSDVILERSENDIGPWERVAGSARAEGSLRVLTDRTTVLGTTYRYRLVGLMPGSQPVPLAALSVQAGAPVTAFELAFVGPNPSRDRVRIDFTVAREASVRLTVLDVQGRTVATLADGTFRPGRHDAVWGRETQRGGVAPAGVYFVRYQAAGHTQVRRVVIAN